MQHHTYSVPIKHTWLSGLIAVCMSANRVADFNQFPYTAVFKVGNVQNIPADDTVLFPVTDVHKAFYRTLDDIHTCLCICYMLVYFYKDGILTSPPALLFDILS